MNKQSPDQSELGKKAAYESHYNPEKLFPIPRKTKRETIGITNKLPFYGYDLWNHYEVSWLNEKGKPIVAVAEIIYGCDTINIIESKSMKLYFNSFNNSTFRDSKTVEDTIKRDLQSRLGTESDVIVNIMPLDSLKDQTLHVRMDGINLDELDITCDTYHTNPELLTTENNIVEETLCSNLLKSNCLVTNQPDWCSLQIQYSGNKINHEGLLRYIISFRNTNEFTEQCIEKIFMHIMQYCKPTSLTVYGRSTRRGGLDINAYRTTEANHTIAPNHRLYRQ